ncbi:hypothetical protein B9T07_23720 [Limnospira fusiformis CCALA 023]|uniref:hypothetical protein n=1 Tax=Oscillatoriales TaxID=1150 RepID=UPI00396E3E56
MSATHYLSVVKALKMLGLAGFFATFASPVPGQINLDFSEDIILAQNSSSDIVWRRLNQQETHDTIDAILGSPMGIAGLNQLAIEGFIGFDCGKSYYQDVDGFRWLLQVNCRTPRGVSTAVGYDEIRVIFNSFEGRIESFTTERHGGDLPTGALRLD